MKTANLITTDRADKEVEEEEEIHKFEVLELLLIVFQGAIPKMRSQGPYHRERVKDVIIDPLPDRNILALDTKRLKGRMLLKWALSNPWLKL